MADSISSDNRFPAELKLKAGAADAIGYYVAPPRESLGILFANRRGLPCSAQKLREKRLRPLLVKLGIPLAGFHAFRHGIATSLVDRGASITTLGAQLRHSDPKITLKLYAHAVPQSQREAVASLAPAIAGSQSLTEARIADSAA